MIKRWQKITTEGQAFHLSVALNEQRMPLPYHGHDFAEVLWVEEGRGIHRINGKRMEMKAGDLAMIRPSDRHSLLAISGEVFRLQNITFNSDTLTRLQRSYFADKAVWFWTRDALPFTTTLDAEQRISLQKEFAWMRQAPRDQLSIDSFLLNLFRILGRGHEPHDQCPDWLENAMRRFGSEEDLADGVRRFFQLAGRSPEHVARTLQKHSGISPTSWVNARRLEHATRLLESSSLPITEIAAICGFENLSYFHRLFRAHQGITPRGHRMRQREVM
ncbi:MAG: AraC family transcriptional regulator [Verrucomicrobiota bacterium]